MQFNNYDIVRIIRPFSLKINGKDFAFDSGVEGVIVESFYNEYLIEFNDKNGEPQYVLIKEEDIVKIWDSLSMKEVND